MLCVSFLELLKGMHKGFYRVLTIRAILETSGPFLGSFLFGGAALFSGPLCRYPCLLRLESSQP